MDSQSSSFYLPNTEIIGITTWIRNTIEEIEGLIAVLVIKPRSLYIPDEHSIHWDTVLCVWTTLGLACIINLMVLHVAHGRDSDLGKRF